MPKRIYLDHNATTPIDPYVKQVIIDLLGNAWGNPSSVHWEGQEARKLLNKSRRTVANFFGVRPQEIVFSSGATEAINLVLRGFFPPGTTGHLISSDLEHSAVYETVKMLGEQGVDSTVLSPGKRGSVSLEQLEEAIRPDTKMIALMAVNNETGAKLDLEGVAALAEQRGIALLVDGVALLGKEQFTLPKGVSAMCFSGHKIHAPKGIGVTVLRKKLKLCPLVTGGGHEHGRRSGTENLIGIAAFAAAIERIQQELPAAEAYVCALRDRFEAALSERLKISINAEGPRACSTSNLCFHGVNAESLLIQMDMKGIAASHGSACHSGALEPSRVLLNMGYSTEEAASSIRFSFCRMSCEEEVDEAVEIITGLVQQSC